MSVLSYLTSKASAAVLSNTEKDSINRSVSTLQSRLGTYFGGDLKSHFRFGSSTRGTILPRSMDEHSDIDYMIVFKDGDSVPQTYLDRLRRFVEKYYTKSEIYQSSPSIVLVLNHIKFDLVPARDTWLSGLQIPNGMGGWQDTNPNDFNARLEEKNKNNLHLIKPTIRLAKYWNAVNAYVYDSFSFEKWIIDRWFLGCVSQRDYLFKVFDDLSAGSEQTQWRRDKVNRAKKIIENVRDYERKSMPVTAEQEVKKLIPG